jgi:hypothetical protein
MNRDLLLLTIPVDVELMELAQPSDASGEPELWGFVLGEQLHVVTHVVEGWVDSEHKYVEVVVQDGRRFMLREDGGSGQWSASALMRPTGAESHRRRASAS